MGLRVFITPKESAHTPEAKAFYTLAYNLKYIFNYYDWNGILLGNPIRKDDPNDWADAILIENNSIIIIDFKNWGGTISLPDEQHFSTGEWRSSNNSKQQIKGGSHDNPYKQVHTYCDYLKNTLSGIIPRNSRINTGVIFHGNNVDLSKAIIPEKQKYTFFVSKTTNNLDEPDSYITNIVSVLHGNGGSNKDYSINLSTSDFDKIRQRFILREELDQEELLHFAEIDSQKEKELRKELNEAIKDLAIEKAAKEKAEKEAYDERKEKLKIKEELEDYKKQAKEYREQISKLHQKNQSSDRNTESIEMEKRLSDELDKINKKIDSLSGSVVQVVEQKRHPFILLLSIVAIVTIASFITVPIIQDKIANQEIIIQTPERPKNLDGPYKAYVIDGDTISVVIDKKQTSIRLIGIEAPETKNNYTNSTKSACYGEKTKSYLIDKIGGKEIYLESDNTQNDKDVYGRLLRYVWYGDELINQTLLAEGYAREFTYNTKYKYHNLFAKSQNKAREESLGLWSSCQK